MAFQTPARHIPGAYVNTPAPVNRRLFVTSSGDVSQSQNSSPTPPVLRAAHYIDQVLSYDESYPDLDSYCRQGTSSECDLFELDTPWAPFARTNTFPIPDSIFEHINSASLSTIMGLFSELNHAWCMIDNALFLWDYTQPNPDLIGFEDQPHAIQSVGLVSPKPGVFVKDITHILVVATTHEVLLLGVAAKTLPSGTKSVSLYQTKMALHNRGVSDIHIIRGSKDGRIFYGGPNETDLYELYYQQEEKWFSSRCGKINHSNPGWSSVVPSVSGLIWHKDNEHLVDIVIDDSRHLVYTLSSKSTIRTYYMEGPDKLTKVIEKEKYHCLRDLSHMINYSNLLTDKVTFVSISPITSTEASRLHLMVLTDTGCRLFLSATSSASYMASASATGAPQSMQVQFIKFPYSTKTRRRPAQQLLNGTDAAVDINSDTLQRSRRGIRYAPGYFLDFVPQTVDSPNDRLFISAPETGRIKLESSSSPASALKYYEHGCWVDLASEGSDIGLVGQPFAANTSPMGFGNELAVQFDKDTSQFAILTNTGVHIIQRRRMVDMFASAIQASAGDEGLEHEARKFIKVYGRVEGISCALAVACGNGNESNSRVRAIDQATEDRARRVFVELGGQPTMREADSGLLSTDNVKLSSRHDALCLYLARLVRSIWKSKVIQATTDKTGALDIVSAISTVKLSTVQEHIERLKTFLHANRGLIQGLSGPSDLQQATSRQEELALQTEHQALYALQKLMDSILEGISFVLMLFDERVIEIFLQLEEVYREKLKTLTYQQLFAQDSGKDLAKILVKAIVNRNIESGSNVETVADALKRRCGSFCSPDDVVIFKAQEQLKKASEQTPNSNLARNLLAESLRLFESVASALSSANLETAISQYVGLRYYAGAIRLCLTVAHSKDSGGLALSWFNDGKPVPDPRKAAMDEREKCYMIIHSIMTKLDQDASQEPEQVDGKLTLMGTKRKEAYDVVNDSEDELFHYNLYDWYIQKEWNDRILGIDSPHVITYLRRLATVNLSHADLLCKFYTHRGRYFDAAEVQTELAQSEFDIGIKNRIALLSRAKANASVTTPGASRQQQQILTHNIADLLEVAHIQDDLLERLLQDSRLSEERREDIARILDGQIMNLTDLFNEYADQANYYDICLLIYHAADFRNPTTVLTTWDNLIAQLHMDVMERRAQWEAGQLDLEPARPYEVVSAKITELAHRSSLDSFIFPVVQLVQLLCKYAWEERQDLTQCADASWPVTLFIQLGVSHEMLVRTLEDMLESNEAPFSASDPPARVRLCEWISFAVGLWIREQGRRGGRVSGTGGMHAGGIGGWVRDLLGRTEQNLPAMGRNEGGECDVPELRRRLRELQRNVESEMGPGLFGSEGVIGKGFL